MPVTGLLVLSRRMRSVRLALCVLLTLHMSKIPEALSYTTLPEHWRAALHHHHQQPASYQGGNGGGTSRWSLAEDACLLHQRHGAAAVSWPNVKLPDRTTEACRNRYRDLKKHNVLAACGPWVAATPAGMLLAVAAAHAPSVHAPSAPELSSSAVNDTIVRHRMIACARGSPTANTAASEACATSSPSAHAAALEARLDALGVQLLPHVRNGLVAAHILMQQNVLTAPKEPWAIEEDACILCARAAGEPLSRLTLARRSKHSVRQRWTRLRAKVPRAMCAFGVALSDQEAPALQVQYKRWTPIAAHRSIPREAEVDWLRGVVRAPASWELRLDSSRYCFYDRAANESLPVDTSDVFSLEDVRPDMTIRTVLHHATKWMRSNASPAIAHAIDDDALRLAVLPEGTPVAHGTPAAYKKDDQVQYRCRDGQVRAATVRSVALGGCAR